MAYPTTHTLFEWMSEYGEYRSLIIHDLDNPEKFRIPPDAIKTPVRYSGYTERWLLAGDVELRLPHRVYLYETRKVSLAR